jgi:hypothetical protein
MAVPLSYSIRSIARSWGVPPWEVTAEEPTPANRSRWYWRERIFTSMEG